MGLESNIGRLGKKLKAMYSLKGCSKVLQDSIYRSLSPVYDKALKLNRSDVWKVIGILNDQQMFRSYLHKMECMYHQICLGNVVKLRRRSAHNITLPSFDQKMEFVLRLCGGGGQNLSSMKL